MNASNSSQDRAQAPHRQFGDYLDILRRRWKVIAAIAASVTAIAVVVSLAMTKRYDATAKLLLNQSDQIAAVVTGRSQQSADPERDLNTNVDLVKVDNVAARVRSMLGLRASTKALLAEVTTSVDGTSNIVSITARDRSASAAAAIANAFASAYVAFRQASARAPLDSAAAQTLVEYELIPAAQRTSPQGTSLAAQYQALQTAARLQTGGVEIVGTATPPTTPSRPRPVLSAIVGGLLGLMLGGLTTMGMELADRRLRDEETVERVLGLPVLATIPRPRPRSKNSDDPGQREAYGLLAASLRYSSLGADFGTVMVTSARAEEGKTSVTIGLARALAMLGQRVIAIEADLRRPAFGRHVSLAGEIGGLAATMRSAAKLQQRLVWIDAGTLGSTGRRPPEGDPSFAVLPAGPPPANPARTLARPELAAVVAAARELADVVLVDTAPLGTVNDAAALISHVDAVLVVVRLAQTTKDAARRTVRRLTDFDVSTPGIVVTDAPSLADDDYSYGAPVASALRR